jgi:hypothetical protein
MAKASKRIHPCFSVFAASKQGNARFETHLFPSLVMSIEVYYHVHDENGQKSTKNDENSSPNSPN